MIKGIRGLMDLYSFQLKNIQNELLLRNIPINCKIRQYICNLIIGHVSTKAAHVNVLLPSIFREDIETMLHLCSLILKKRVRKGLLYYNYFSYF